MASGAISPPPDLHAATNDTPIGHSRGVAVPAGSGHHAEWIARATLIFVIVGIGLRLIRFAQNLPLWSDECFLAANLIDRSYGELLRPLDNAQVCPVFFLWIERFVVDCLGFQEWSLRLFALVCGVASVPLFWHLTRRILDGLPVLIAVAIFAVSLHPIRHSAEVKPYATDLLVALVLMTLAVEWLRSSRARTLWTLAIATPLAMGFSNPAVFVAAAVGLSLAIPVWRSRSRGSILAFGTFLVLSAVGFLMIYTGVSRQQGAAADDALKNYWSLSFPPIHAPSGLIPWFLSVHTGSMFAYPGGGAQGLSAGSFVMFLIGSLVLIRRGKTHLGAILLLPFGLGIAAAALKRYPYGGEARLMQYVAPSICILMGIGIAWLLERFRRERPRVLAVRAILAGLMVCGIAPQVVSYRHPFRMLYDREAREFARDFWPAQCRDADVACVHLDYGLLRHGQWNGRKAWYLCNQAIYSPARRRGVVPSGSQGYARRPLRCIAFEESPESPRMRAWLTAMETRYRIDRRERLEIPVSFGGPNAGKEQWEIFEMTPKLEVAGQEPTTQALR